MIRNSRICKILFVLISCLTLINTSAFSAVKIDASDNCIDGYLVQYPEAVKEYVSSYIFNGDKHGDFKGGFVIVLNDGSAWKVHPEDQVKFSNWLQGESVFVGIRGTCYWFKREHKYYLYNITRKEFVRAMIVDYSDSSLEVVSVSKPYFSQTLSKGIYDDEGNWLADVPCRVIDMILSDGSKWIRTYSYGYLKVRTKVYVTVKLYKHSAQFCLIYEKERESKYMSVYHEEE